MGDAFLEAYEYAERLANRIEALEADLARRRAENEALRTERDAAVLMASYEAGEPASLEAFKSWIDRAAAAEAKAARLETALTDMIALAEADHVCLVSWNGSGSGMNYEGIMATARAALEAKP